MRTISVPVEMLRAILWYDEMTGALSWTQAGLIRRRSATVSRKNAEGYLTFSIGKTFIFAHRAAWALHFGEWPDGFLDHINGVKDDNRIANLRIATHSQNKANTAARKDNTHGFKGISPRSNGNWRAQIRVNGKDIHLGYFLTPGEASAAYALAAKANFGDFSCSARTK